MIGVYGGSTAAKLLEALMTAEAVGIVVGYLWAFFFGLSSFCLS